MLSASLFDAAKRVLCIGAHPDDIEIGCGGTLLSLRDADRDVDIRFLVLTGSDERAAEARASAELFLGDQSRLTIHGFRDGFLPYESPDRVKETLIEARSAFKPDLVFAPPLRDAHQDHRVLGQFAWQIFRDQVILAYEILKYESDLGAVNAFVPVSSQLAKKKVDYLFDAYGSQLSKAWFDRVAFLGLMRLRGVNTGKEEGYAEGFHLSKLLLV